LSLIKKLKYLRRISCQNFQRLGGSVRDTKPVMIVFSSAYDTVSEEIADSEAGLLAQEYEAFHGFLY
jgi:hypothetical protein